MWRVLLAQSPEPSPDPLQTAIPSNLTAWDWMWAGIIFASSIVLAQVVRRLVERGFRQAGGERTTGRMIGRVLGYVIILSGLVYALNQLGLEIAPLLGALGIAGIAIAFALQDTLQNFIAGLFLETRRPFRRGDQIETEEHEGVVEDINLRSVIIRTFDGKRVVIPNSTVINSPIVNFTALGARRTSLVVGVAYDADLERAQRVILDAVRSVEEVLPDPEPEAFVEEFADSSINFSVRFWHIPGRQMLWRARDRVAISVKRALDEAGITIPFPQRTLWFRDTLRLAEDEEREQRGLGASEPG